MPVAYNFKKGIDTPTWQWLTQCPVSALVSGRLNYDGFRYIWSWNSAAIYRYDTWTNAWQFLATPGVGIAGQDVQYDQERNILISTVTGTTWQVFNLNATAVTVAAVSCAAWAVTTMTPILPTTLATGAVLVMPRPVAAADTVRSGLVSAAGGTTTNLVVSTAMAYQQLVGLEVLVTSGTQINARRQISAVVDSRNITLAPALAGAMAAGDTFTIEQPKGTSSGTNTTLVLNDTTKAWIVNKYTNYDVEITGGTGVGQRRRIASNTANVLTLSTAVAGSARTGPWTTVPDATSTYRIVPSTDFLYYGTGTTFWKLEVTANPAAVWTAILAHPAGQLAGGGADFSRGISHSSIFATRGGTSTTYVYDIGLNTWTLLSTFGLGPTEIFSTGASMVLLSGMGRMVVLNDSSTQLFLLDLATLIWEPAGNHPYVAGTAVEGKRIEEVISADGARWLYVLRTGGQEAFRVPLEWL